MAFTFSSQRSSLSCVVVLGLVATLVACSGSGRDRNRARLPDVELNPRQFNVDIPLQTVNFAGAGSLDLTLSVGSGAFHVMSDESPVFYTVTDRGPTIDCADSGEVLGDANFCGGRSGSIFALPDYTPRILRWEFDGVGSDLRLQLVEEDTLELQDEFGNPFIGLPNDFQQATTEQAIGPDGELLANNNPNSVDPEAIVRLDDGRFWLAEENGPSLLLVDVDGTVLQRQVPAGLAADLAGSTVEVREDILPGILARRKVGRGIEALALSPDNQFLYFIMQSPLRNPDDEAFENSRIVRVGKVALNEDGTADTLVGLYLYRLDAPSQYGEAGVQSDITVNEASAVGLDDLLVVEQAAVASKIYRINLANAVSIKDSEWNVAATDPSLEQQSALAEFPFVPKQLVYDSVNTSLPQGISALPRQLEGLALLSANFAAVTFDNDYGVRGEPARIVVLPITSLLQNVPAPVVPRLDYEDSASATSGDVAFDADAAQAVAVDSAAARMFVVNNQRGVVDVFNISDPLAPSSDGELSVDPAAANVGINAGRIGGVAVGGEYIAVTVANSNPQQNGIVAFYRRDTLALDASVIVGAAPKSLVFDQQGLRLMVANEGYPSDDYSVDPVGSVSVLDLSNGLGSVGTDTIGFSDFNLGGARAVDLPAEVLITGPGATVAEDLEPEQLALGLDNRTLFVGLQENNAVAMIDLNDLSITRIAALGSKDFGSVGQGIDANDNGVAEIRRWPGVVGLYQPSGIAAYQHLGQNYFVTVNEGAPRAYPGFNEVSRAQQLLGDIDADNPSVGAAASTSELGRLNVSRVTGDNDGDGLIDDISAFGGRSFSIRDAQGQLIYDSGDDFAQISLSQLGNDFNDRDNASDDFGARPKAVTLAASQGRVYAYITLQASGGVMVYDVTSPFGVQFVQYVNNRSFSADPAFDSGDVGPVGVTVFNFEDSAYVAVANSRSGNVRIFEVDPGTGSAE